MGMQKEMPENLIKNVSNGLAQLYQPNEISDMKMEIAKYHKKASNISLLEYIKLVNSIFNVALN